MKYVNAKEILPSEVLLQVQKYAAGKLLYIPINGNRVAWGALTGSRLELHNRNNNICNEYRAGANVDELADKYCLTAESIRKIIYSPIDKNTKNV